MPTQYNSDQWVIFNYPVAAAGKLLITSFLQFNSIANWCVGSQSMSDTIAWYARSLPYNKDLPWANNEIDTPWSLPSISRTWPRGSNVTEQDFNSTLDSVESHYFKEAWKSRKYIPEFWHKGFVPPWWTNANWVSIVIDDFDLYKKLLFSKTYEYDALKKTVTCHNLRPGIGSASNNIQKAVFKNQWYWENVTDPDTFFKEEITKTAWYQSWDFDKPAVGNCICLTDLFDVDSVYKFLLQYEDMFNQKVSYDYTKQIHALWYNATIEKIKIL